MAERIHEKECPVCHSTNHRWYKVYSDRGVFSENEAVFIAVCNVSNSLVPVSFKKEFTNRIVKMKGKRVVQK